MRLPTNVYENICFLTVSLIWKCMPLPVYKDRVFGALLLPQPSENQTHILTLAPHMTRLTRNRHHNEKSGLSGMSLGDHPMRGGPQITKPRSLMATLVIRH